MLHFGGLSAAFIIPHKARIVKCPMTQIPHGAYNISVPDELPEEKREAFEKLQKPLDKRGKVGYNISKDSSLTIYRSVEAGDGVSFRTSVEL